MHSVDHEGLHREYNGTKAKGENSKNLREVELLVKTLESTNNTTKTKQQLYTTLKINKLTPRKSQKWGNRLVYQYNSMSTTLFTSSVFLSFLFFSSSFFIYIFLSLFVSFVFSFFFLGKQRQDTCE